MNFDAHDFQLGFFAAGADDTVCCTAGTAAWAGADTAAVGETSEDASSAVAKMELVMAKCLSLGRSPLP